MKQIVQHPLFPMLAGVVSISLFLQAIKWLARSWNFRHTDVFERVLPVIPLVTGTVVFGIFPTELAVDHIIDAGDHSRHILGAFFGFVLGFASIGAYKVALDKLPESWSDALRVQQLTNE